MANYSYIDADGNQIKGSIPDFALESTAQEMLKALNTIIKADANTAKSLQALVDYAKDSAKTEEANTKINNDIRDGINRVSDGIQDVADNTESSGGGGTGRFAALGEKVFTKTYSAVAGLGNIAWTATKSVAGLALGVAGVAAGITTALGGSFLELGSTLNRMTASGVGFADGLSQGGMGAIDAMTALKMSGVDAAEVMMRYSNVVQSMGKKQFVGLTKSFLDATASGAALGLSLEDSTDRLGQELQRRQLMGALDTANQTRSINQINTTIKRQQVYAAALGVSTDELTKFADSLVTDTTAVSASLLRFGPATRSSMVAAITDFGTGMLAMGGVEGGKLATAIVEAGAMGAIGMSESMTGYITALPSLGPTVNKYIDAMQKGTLSQEGAIQMQQDITNRLGSIGESERNRIFALARTGDQYANSLASAILQFEQSKSKIKEINDTLAAGLNMEGVQKGTNTFNAIISKVTGTFGALRDQFLQGFGSAKGLFDIFESTEGKTSLLQESFNKISSAIGSALSKIFNLRDGTGGLINGVEGLGKSFGENLPEYIARFTDGLVDFINNIPTWINNIKEIFTSLSNFFKDENGNFSLAAAGDKIIDSVKSAIVEAMPTMLKYIAIGLGSLFAASVVTSALKKGVIGLLSRGAAGSPASGGPANTATRGAAGGMLEGIANGLKAIGGVPYAAILKGSIVIGVITVAIMGLGKALEIATPGIKALGEALANIIREVAPIAIKMIDKVGDVILGFIDKIPPILESIGTMISTIVTGISSGILSIFEGLSTSVSTVLTGMSTVIESIGGTITGIIDSISGGISNVIGKVSEAIVGIRTAGADAENIKMEGATASIKELASIDDTRFTAISTGISSIAGSLVSFSEAVGDDSFFGFGGSDIDKQLEQVGIFKLIAELDPDAINASSSAISLFTSVMSSMPTLGAFFSDEANDSFENLIDRLDDFSDLNGNDILRNANALKNVFDSTNIQVAARQPAPNTTGPTPVETGTRVVMSNNANTIAAPIAGAQTVATPFVGPQPTITPAETTITNNTEVVNTPPEKTFTASSSESEILAEILNELRRGNRINRQGADATRDLAANI